MILQIMFIVTKRNFKECLLMKSKFRVSIIILVVLFCVAGCNVTTTIRGAEQTKQAEIATKPTETTSYQNKTFTSSKTIGEKETTTVSTREAETIQKETPGLSDQRTIYTEKPTTTTTTITSTTTEEKAEAPTPSQKPLEPVVSKSMITTAKPTTTAQKPTVTTTRHTTSTQCTTTQNPASTTAKTTASQRPITTAKPTTTATKPTTTAKPTTTTPVLAGSYNYASADEFISLLNDYRTSKGKCALQKSSTLTNVALKRAVEITTNFSHDGIGEYGNYGENIFMGSGHERYNLAITALDAFKNSPGHDVNQLYEAYRFIGVAHYITPGGAHYWAVIFSF